MLGQLVTPVDDFEERIFRPALERLFTKLTEPGTGPGVTLAFREAGPADGPVALLVHGFPQSSYMWRDVLPAVAAAGWRGLAPDLAGFGDSPLDPPGTWERQVEALEALPCRARRGALRAS